MYVRQGENFGFVAFFKKDFINGSQKKQASETRTSKIPYHFRLRTIELLALRNKATCLIHSLIKIISKFNLRHYFHFYN